MNVNTVFLGDALISSNLGLKLQKGDKAAASRHYKPVSISVFTKLQKLFMTP